MMDRRIDREALPPLPDDFDAAASARQQAQRRVTEARESESGVLGWLGEVREMRMHNGWGPMLEEAFGLRGTNR
jgi:hypothetical protein